MQHSNHPSNKPPNKPLTQQQTQQQRTKRKPINTPNHEPNSKRYKKDSTSTTTTTYESNTNTMSYQLSDKLPPLKNIEGIQCMWPSTSTIRKMSVIQVSECTHLTSEYLGIVQIEQKCKTCHNVYPHCPGHWGHLELNIPIFRILYVKVLMELLNSICFYCQRIRIPTTDPNYTTLCNTPIGKRLAFARKHSNCYKWCGQCDLQRIPPESIVSDIKQQLLTSNGESSKNQYDLQWIKEHGCHQYYVNFTKDKDSVIVIPHIQLCDQDLTDYTQNPTSWKPVSIGPLEILTCLKSITKETYTLLGFTQHTLPASLMWENIPIPSHNCRPDHTMGGMGSARKTTYHEWTRLLKYIVQANITLKNTIITESKDSNENKESNDINLSLYSYKDIEYVDWKKCFNINTTNETAIKMSGYKLIARNNIESEWIHLQNQVAAFQSFSHKKLSNKGQEKYNTIKDNVPARYHNSKNGRMRDSVSAQRTNHGMRGVLGGSITLRPDQVGLPRSECMKVTRKINVNTYNMHLCQLWILNGPHIHPGANYIRMKSGIEINLATIENRRDIDISQVLYIHRHVIDNDVVMCTRQPILHRGSMFACKAKLHDEFVIRLHYSNLLILAGDCDGDELNIYIIQNDAAIAEAIELSWIGHNIMRDGKIWVGFIHNAVVGAYLMTSGIKYYTFDDISAITGMLDIWEYPEPTILKPSKLWTGLQIVSLILPREFHLDHMETDNKCQDNDTITFPSQTQLIIRNGQALHGNWNYSNLNGDRGIINTMYRNNIHERKAHQNVLDFIFFGYQMFQKVVDEYGVSAGLYDCGIDPHLLPNYPKHQSELNNIQSCISRASNYINSFPNHTVPIAGKGDIELESNIRLHVDDLVKASSDVVIAYHQSILHSNSKEENGLLHIVQSGSKGSANLMNQMAGISGQVYVMHHRYPFITSHTISKSNKMTAHGFVTDSLFKGKSLVSMICEAHSCCESAAIKNKTTARSGYTFRKMATCMQGVEINQAGQAVDTDKKVIWSDYGDDGYHAQLMAKVPLRIVRFDSDQILDRYSILFYKNDIIDQELLNDYCTLQLQDGTLICYQHHNDTLHKEAIIHWNIILGIQSQSSPLSSSSSSSSTTSSFAGDEVKIRKIADHGRELIKLQQQLRMSQTRLPGATRSQFDVVRMPISFDTIVNQAIANTPTDTLPITPWDYFEFRRLLWIHLIQNKLVVPNNILLQAVFEEYLNIKTLLYKKCGWTQLKWLIQHIPALIRRTLVQPGECVGALSAQNIGEPYTQESLKAPHFTGKFTEVISGTQRVSQLIDNKYSNVSMNIVLNNNIKLHKDALWIALTLMSAYVSDIMKGDGSIQMDENSQNFTCTIPISKYKCISRAISLYQVCRTISHSMSISLENFQCPFMDDEPFNEQEPWILTIEIPIQHEFCTRIKNKSSHMNDILIGDFLYRFITNNILINGIVNMKNFVVDDTKIINPLNGIEENRWSIITLGSNLSYVLQLPDVDSNFTITNDVVEIGQVLGILAARKALEYEFSSIMGQKTDIRHIRLVSRLMTISTEGIQGMKISQTGQRIPPIQRASYEHCNREMIHYCGKAEIDHGETVSGAVICNKRMKVGTGIISTITNYPKWIISNNIKTPNYQTNPINIQSSIHNVPIIQSYAVTLVFDAPFQYIVLCTDQHNQPCAAIIDHHKKTTILPTESTDPSKSLYSGTVWKIQSVLIPGECGIPQQLFIFHDVYMNCGHNVTTLRLDQRIEILREGVFRLTQGNLLRLTQGNLLRLTQGQLFKSQVYNLNILQYPHIYPLPISNKSIVSSTFMNIHLWNSAAWVCPLFNIQGISALKSFAKQCPLPTKGLAFYNYSSSLTNNNPASINNGLTNNTGLTNTTGLINTGLTNTSKHHSSIPNYPFGYIPF